MKTQQKLSLAALLVTAFAYTTMAVAQEHDEHGHGQPGTHAPAGHGDVHHGAGVAADHGAHAGDQASHDAHAAAEHDDHAGGHHGPEAINWADLSDKKRPAFIALVINFGVLATLYYVLGKKPVAEGLKQRRVTVGKNIEEAEKRLAEAKERAKKYQSDRANADADAEMARAALVSAGRGDADRVVREANERAERMKRDAERLVEQERAQLQQDLHGETVELALAEAEKVLRTSATAEDHTRLANDLLAELARHPASNVRASTGGAS